MASVTTEIQEAYHDRVETAEAWPRAVANDLAYLRTAMVNLYFSGVEGAGDRNWVLIDAGLPGFTQAIVAAAAERFGPGARPSAILLTHGHCDHVGTLKGLAERWDAPVFAHELELPYLTGRSSYPPPDPTVGGGAMAWFSWMLPRGPIDLGRRVQPLPADGSVPFMPGWRWVATPGHSPGHVSFFREGDRALIAGDAFVATRQESALAILAQRREIHGPPKYFTCDWMAARKSIEALAALRPALALTGHGLPMQGDELAAGLAHLLRDFDDYAYPARGRYAQHPAIADASGVVSVPPEKPGIPPQLIAGLALGALAGLTIGRITKARRR